MAVSSHHVLDYLHRQLLEFRHHKVFTPLLEKVYINGILLERSQGRWTHTTIRRVHEIVSERSHHHRRRPSAQWPPEGAFLPQTKVEHLGFFKFF